MASKIIDIVSACYGVKPCELNSKSRKGVLPEARRMAAIFIMEKYGHKYACQQLNRCRTFARWAQLKLDDEMAIYSSVKARYDEIKKALNNLE